MNLAWRLYSTLDVRCRLRGQVAGNEWYAHDERGSASCVMSEFTDLIWLLAPLALGQLRTRRGE